MINICKKALLLVLCLVTVLSAPLSASATDATTETRGPEQAKAGFYEFDIEDMWIFVGRDHMNGKALTGELVSQALSEYYDKNELNWKYATDNLSLYRTDSNKVSNTFVFGGTTSNKWRGLRLGAHITENGSKRYIDGYWIAITFRAPEPGWYDVKLDYMVREDGTPAGQTYFLDGKYGNTLEIEALLTQDTLLATTDFSGKTQDGKTYEPASAELGRIHVTQEEFTMVFRADSKVSENSCCYMVLTEMELLPADAPENPAGKVEQMIDALGEKPSKEALEAAKKAYDALSEADRKLVKNAARLSALEKKMNEAEEQKKLITTVIIASAAVVVTVVAVTVIVVTARKKSHK